jgi:hypothetical protein
VDRLLELYVQLTDDDLSSALAPEEEEREQAPLGQGTRGR